MYYNALLPKNIYLQFYELMFFGYFDRNSFDAYVNSFPIIRTS